MQNDEKYILPPEIESEISNFYNMAFQSKNYQSPIFSELQQIERHFSNKTLISSGGMKHIYTVYDQRTARKIVMAELNKDGIVDQEELEQFLREARITAALEHPNIMPIYDISLNQSGKPFFTMKFLKGQSLKQIIRELLKANPAYVNSFDLNILLDIFIKVCDAVAFAHSCGIIHLDIKPDNVMVGDYGEVYLCDWGLAKLLTSTEVETSGDISLDENILNDITLSGFIKGTPGFMAPEQISRKFGDKTKQTDIYSIGALLYTILSFKKPFSGLRVEEIIKSTIHDRPSPLKDVATKEIPESLDAICVKAMSKKQVNRYESVDKIITDVRSYQAGFSTTAEENDFIKKMLFLIKRNKVLSSVIMFAIACVLLMTGVFVSKIQDKESQTHDEIVSVQQGFKAKLRQAKSEQERAVKRLATEIKKRDKDILALNSRFELIQSLATKSAISINLLGIDSSDNILNEREVAGLVECSFWENVGANKGFSSTDINNLRDNFGLSTGVKLAMNKASDYDEKICSKFNSDIATASDKFMGTWCAFGRGGTITLTGLNKFATKYDVIIYCVRQHRDLMSKITIRNSHYFTTNRGELHGPFKQSLYKSKRKCKAGEATNYVRFNDLTGDELVIKLERYGALNIVPVSGIQIIRKEKKKSF